ncbi:hypothetical protein AMS68_005792 [Peltaster fructicola]|uniref:Uncharacterized protein n=1 Tax=Peltaster fructicola TaxID=286661 RepID=A0A6H0Y038_9PEZI|nr:hypothetical protein AMS68_005792 [Peltaster fructicola]
MPPSLIIKDLLDEYRSRLGLDGSSNVLVSDEEVYHTIEQWCKNSYMSYMPVIALADEVASTDSWPYQEDNFTHIFATIKDTDKASLQYLKWIQWSLRYKGIAIFTLAQGITAEHADIVEFVETASFERGRIRVLDRNDGDHTSRVAIAMKWDLLSA